MNKSKIGLTLSLLFALWVGFTSCKEQKPNHKLLLNEVLMLNESNYQDDYGMHSAWIEVFNKSFSSVDIAGYQLRASSQQGDTMTYFVPKGDVLTVVKPRQHTLFWADAHPDRGTFHTNFLLNPEANTWIGLYDSGRKLIDELMIPAGTLGTNLSYARVSDAANEWEIKGLSKDKYVTPSTNNMTISGHEKMEKFEQHDKKGVGMSVSAMSVVFSGLLLLFLSFFFVGRAAVGLSNRKANKPAVAAAPATPKKGGQVDGEVYAAIAMALHEEQNEAHDFEDMVLTIRRPTTGEVSPWSAKSQTLREMPQRK